MNLFSLGGWSWLWETINGLLLVLCDLIYSLIYLLYQVFVSVAKVNLFSEEIFDKFTKRIYILVGIVMLFIFAYNIILLIVNPDDKKKIGQTSKLVKETIMAIVLVVLLPTIFRWAYVFQGNVLDSQIIGQIILGPVGSTAGASTGCAPDDYDCTCDYSSFTKLDGYYTSQHTFLRRGPSFWTFLTNRLFGTPIERLERECEYYRDELDSQTRGAYVIPSLLISAFYRPSFFSIEDCEDYLRGISTSVTSAFDQGDHDICVNYYYDVKMSMYVGDISPFVRDDRLRQMVSDTSRDDLTFDGLFAIVAGVIAVWMFFCYAMEIGVRVAKLGFLQIVSPVPVMMRIIKYDIYKKWQDKIISTYVEVFIRLAIIYFALFAISCVPDALDTLFTALSVISAPWYIKGIAAAFIILGILKFAQDAPALLKEFFGNAGTFAIRSPRKQFNENKLAKGAVGMATGSVLGLASGFAQKKPLKALGGIFRGGKNGARNMYGADLTKKGTFMDTIKNSKYQTDYEQNNTKFRAIRSGIKQAGGVGGYIKGGFTDFVDFLKDSNNQSDRYSAANKLFADSASINDVIINGIIKDEAKTKELWADNKELGLGDRWFRRDNDRGVWIDNSGNEYNKSEMEKEMKKYFAKAKADAMAQKLNDSDNKVIRESFKNWSEDFKKTMQECLPKLGKDIGDNFFKVVSNEGGIQVSSLDELINTMNELQKRGLAGDQAAFEQLARIKISMDGQFKAMKDGQYQDMHAKTDKK